jgi:hypothetical protein
MGVAIALGKLISMTHYSGTTLFLPLFYLPVTVIYCNIFPDKDSATHMSLY